MPGCRVTFENGLPQEYGVTIIGIGAHFFYRSGRDYQTSKQVNLTAGHGDNIDADSPNECVASIVAVISCIQTGHPSQTLTKSVSAAPNMCEVDFDVSICPSPKPTQAFISIEEALNSRDIDINVSGSTAIRL